MVTVSDTEVAGAHQRLTTPRRGLGTAIDIMPETGC